MMTGMTTLAYIGPTEVWIVVGVLVLLFGAAKIPQLAKGLGEGIREFKKSVDTNGDETSAATTTETTTRRVTTADADEAAGTSSGRAA